MLIPLVLKIGAAGAVLASGGYAAAALPGTGTSIPDQTGRVGYSAAGPCYGQGFDIAAISQPVPGHPGVYRTASDWRVTDASPCQDVNVVLLTRGGAHRVWVGGELSSEPTWVGHRPVAVFTNAPEGYTYRLYSYVPVAVGVRA